MLWIAPTGNYAADDILEERLRAAGRQSQIQHFHRTRDLLLPRLLSGQVKLAELEVFA